jgi:Tol biopolymer transport system component
MAMAVALASGAAVAAHAQAGPTGSVRPPELAFVLNRDGWNEIWTIRADGSDRRRLTAGPPRHSDAAGANSPTWSPNGRWIAYSTSGPVQREDERDSEIWVMRADGTHKRRLTHNHVPDWSPSWSPDGRVIAFVRVARSRTERLAASIYLMTPGGHLVTRLTPIRSRTLDGSPRFSPDARTVAFTRFAFTTSAFGAVGIYSMPTTRGRPRLLAEGSEPAWSPDGMHIAFTSFRDRNGETCFHECDYSGELYLMKADGSDQHRITVTQPDDKAPGWSPAGTKLAFSSDRRNRADHAYDLYVMNADGTCVRRITRSRFWAGSPAWRPTSPDSGPLAC